MTFDMGDASPPAYSLILYVYSVVAALLQYGNQNYYVHVLFKATMYVKLPSIYDNKK